MKETEFLNIKNMTKEEIKNYIENDIPKMNIHNKLYIYDTVGSILFRNKWETVWKMFDTSSKEINLEFIKVLHFTNLYNIKEKTDITNIMFQKVLNLLVNDSNSKRL
tara:strand:+ start:915 stop:1235 length:321 start_codon:yes stop_codon:yes gene_type:complete